MSHDTTTTQVTLADAVSGMVLHTDVTGKSGQVLLPAGITLTDRHLKLLSANGIENLAIRSGDDGSKKKEKTPLTATEITSNLENRFSDNNPEHPLIKELARICRARMEAE